MRRFIGPLVLLLIVTGFYWKLVMTRQYDWMWSPDLAQQVLPWFEEESRQVTEGHLPLWDPHTWAGQPFLGQAQPGAAYPLNWLLFALPRSDGHINMAWLQWYYVLIHYMGALFCYLLCRDLRRTRMASLIAASLFGLGGYLATTGWPQMLNGVVWAPLVLLFLLRAARGERPRASAALCGLFLGMSWLSGHHQAPLLLTLAAGCMWLFFAVREGRLRWHVARLAALCLLIALLAGALQILPAIEYGRYASRWAGPPQPLTWNDPIPYRIHERYSLSPIELLGTVFPLMGGYTDTFTGIAGFALVIAGVVLCWRRREVRLFTALGLAAILYALGGNDVLQGLFYAAVPLVEKARAPAAAVFLFSLSAAVLAAFAVDALPGPLESRLARRFALGSAILGTGIFALILGVRFINRQLWPLDNGVGMTALAALLLAALLWAWHARALTRRLTVLLLLLLVLIELGNEGPATFAERTDPVRSSYLWMITSNPDVAAFLSAQPKPFRIESADEDLPVNWGAYHNLDVFRAYTASATSNLAGLAFLSRDTKRLFNVRYIIGRRPPEPDSHEVFKGAGGLRVYEDPGAFPRAWTVHELAQGGRLPADGLDRRAVLTGDAPHLATCPGKDQVVFLNHAPAAVLLRVNMSCEGMLVLSDTFFPGWRAQVDRRGAPIHQVNVAMRGVVVPAGSHEVRFVYRPLSVYLGAALTLMGIGLALAFLRIPEAHAKTLPGN